MARKNNRNLILGLVVAGAVILLATYGLPGLIEKASNIVNNGVAISPVIMDANGNVIQELAVITFRDGRPMTIVAKETGTGYIEIDNTGTFLGFQTQLDNTAGDSEVTITGVTADNKCSWDNPLYNDPECTGLPNIMGPSGAGNGDLDALWAAQLPQVLPKGEVSPVVSTQAGSLDLSGIEYGLMNFSIEVTGGTYLDEQGQPQTLLGAGGHVILKIAAQQCGDGTEADATLATDAPLYCSTVNEGKYCRVDAYGITTLIDYASYCGCEAGWYALGDVCVPIANCEDTWGADTCEPGGIRFCNAGGTITNECATCYTTVPGDQCPVNANGDSATGCQPDTNSECVYPAATGAGFLVDLAEPTIDPITECGDGVKNGAEECDGTDFGGETCSGLGYSGGTLACFPDGHAQECEYDEGGCFASNIGFRTSSRSFPDAISADNWVAWRSTGCGLDLTGYGYDSKSGSTTESCDTRFGVGNKVITDINSGGSDVCDLAHLDQSQVDTEGDGEISVYVSGQYVYLCEDDIPSSDSGWYRYSSSRSNNGETDSAPVGGYETREISC